jgi:hypothetical protein
MPTATQSQREAKYPDGGKQLVSVSADGKVSVIRDI